VAIDRLVMLDLEAGTGSIQFSQAEHPTDLGFSATAGNPGHRRNGTPQTGGCTPAGWDCFNFP